MSLEKIIVVDKIEIVENGCVQVRTATKILENGKEVNRAFLRHVIAPGDNYGTEDAKVKSICSIVHTPEIIAAYKIAIAEQGV
jgi:hypothetical protein